MAWERYHEQNLPRSQELINKYLGIRTNIPATYAAVISKIQQVSSSAICNLVNELRDMYLIKEPGIDVNTLGSQGIKKN